MILKKPYAFLIKYFKVIHFILAILLGFIMYKYAAIVNFYRAYVKNNYKTSIILNLNKTYTPSYLYILIFLVLFLLMGIIVLLNHKKKPIKLYTLSFIYYLILFLATIYLSNVFKSFETSLLAATVSRRIRDILIIGFIPQLPIMIFIILRAIGFNIKKFDFTHDLKELDANYQDAEEFELNINFDSHKIKRNAHRTYREFIYYVRENKFIFICISIILIIALGIFIFTHKVHNNYDRNYKTGQEFVYNDLNVTINDSIITNLNYSGDIIEDDAYFLVINISANNTSGHSIKMDYNDFKLIIGDKKITPSNSYIKNFLDFVNTNIPTSISHNTKKDFGIVYKLSKEDLNSSKKIAIFNGTFIEDNETLTKNIYIKINPTVIDQENTQKFNINEEVSLNSTLLKESSFKITNYQLSKRYLYNYDICEDDNCLSYLDAVVPSSSNKILVILEMSLMSSNSYYFNNFKTVSNFIDNFAKINFTANDKEYTEFSNVSPDNNSSVAILEVDENILNATDINISFKIRNYNYVLNIIS